MPAKVNPGGRPLSPTGHLDNVALALAELLAVARAEGVVSLAAIRLGRKMDLQLRAARAALAREAA